MNAALPYSQREQRGWYMYDWANSTFPSTVVTLFLGPYLTALAKAAAGPDGRVHPLGIPVDPRSWWGYLISISVVTQIFTLPIAGTIADFSPNKKRLMALFAYTGALATAAMFFLHGDEYLDGRCSLSGRESGLRRVHRGLQLVLARYRATRTARRGVVHRLGHWIPGRRTAAGAEPGAVHQSQSAGVFGIHGGADQSFVGGRLVGALQRDSAGCHPQSSAGADARPGRRADGNLPGIRGYSARHAALSADAAISDRLLALQRRRAGRDCAVRPVRQR